MCNVKQAVCAFIVSDNGKVLTVSRKDDPDNIGLPGGKVDKDETLENALIRETLEETGFHIKVSIPLYKDVDKFGYEVTTFLAFINSDIPYVQPSDEETGIVAMNDFASLLCSSFKEYNIDMLTYLKLL